MQYWYAMATAALSLLLLFGIDALYLSKANLPERSDWRLDFVLFLGAWLVLFSLNNHEFVVYNNYSYLTDALLHGRLDTPDLPAYLESFELGGKIYMHFAPGVSLLLLPIAAITGAQTINYAYVGITLGAGSFVLFFRLLENLGIGRNVRERFWCAAFVIFGTVHCFCAAVAHSWFIGHAASWFLLFLSMYFATRRYRSAIGEGVGVFFAGLMFGLCVCCRLSNLLGAGVFVYFMLHDRKKTWLRSGLLFAAGAAVFGGLYMGLNVARFGTVMDESYNLTHLKDLFKPLYYFMQEHLSTAKEQMAFLHAVEKTDWSAAFPTLADRTAFLDFLARNAGEGWNYCRFVPESVSGWTAPEIDEAFRTVVESSFPTVGGALQLRHAPANLWSIFCLMPEFSTESPFVIPTLAGVSITFCSPLVYAGLIPLWTRRREPLPWILLATAVIAAVPFVLNYGNGFAQFGMRYAMDFLPYALLLACMGLTATRWRTYRSALVLLCVLVNVWGPIYWNCFYLVK